MSITLKELGHMFVILMLTLLSVFICYYIAKSRNGRAMYWAFLAAVFGPFAIPFVFFSKPSLVL
jgi:hypothetical protein